MSIRNPTRHLASRSMRKAWVESLRSHRDDIEDAATLLATIADTMDDTFTRCDACSSKHYNNWPEHQLRERLSNITSQLNTLINPEGEREWQDRLSKSQGHE